MSDTAPEPVWSRQYDYPFVTAMYRGDVYVLRTDDRTVRVEVVNSKTGGRRWQSRFSTDLSTEELRLAVLARDRVAILTAESAIERLINGAVHGVTPAGRQWRYPPESTASLDLNGSTDELVFASERSGGLVAIDAASGTSLWQSSSFGGDLAAGSDTTFYPSGDATQVSAVDTLEGTTNWVFARNGERLDFSPAIVGGTAFIRREDSPGLYALNAETGSLKWQLQIENRRDPGRFDGFIRQDTVFCATDTELFAVDSMNGNERWRENVTSEKSLITAWGLGEKNAYLSTNSSGTELRARTLSDGSIRWEVDAGETIERIISPVPAQVDINSFEFERVQDISPPDSSSRIIIEYISSDRSTGTFDRGIQAHNTDTGDREWRVDGVAPIHPDRLGVYPEDNSAIYSFDLIDGSLNWQFTEGNEREIEHVTPGFVYISTQSDDTFGLHAIERSQKP